MRCSGLLTCLFVSAAYASPVLGPTTESLLADDFSTGKKGNKNPDVHVLPVDDFTTGESEFNKLGFWHGGDPNLHIEYGPEGMVITPSDVALSYYTRLSETCVPVGDNWVLHVEFVGSPKFSIGLQQHNYLCNEKIAPYPETWDEVEASRYAKLNDIYIPLSHFKIDKTRTVGIVLRSFWSSFRTIIRKIELVDKLPAKFQGIEQWPSSELLFACTRLNSFALAIDDGSPALAQEVMQIIKEEAIPVTFFTVGTALLDESANFSNVYREMKSLGHQVALHSWSHPSMESLATYDEIDAQYQRNIDAYRKVFGTESKYFRPPYGNVGARMRHRLAAIQPGTRIINWDIDVEDYKWAATETPERQLEAFKRDIARGGSLMVSHYLSQSTVGYFREFIRLAKETGKTLMRVDQCMEDPEAPALA